MRSDDDLVDFVRGLARVLILQAETIAVLLTALVVIAVGRISCSF